MMHTGKQMRPEAMCYSLLWGNAECETLFIAFIFWFICLPVNYTCFNRHTQEQNSSSVFSSTDYNTITAGKMQALFPNVQIKIQCHCRNC